MSRIFKVALKLRALGGAALVALANLIVSMMTGNANTPTPDPSLASITTSASDYDTALANVEQAKQNLKAATADAVQKRKALELLLTSEARYVDSVALGNKTIIESTGMPASDEPSPVHLQPVEDLSLTRGDDKGHVDAHWHAIAESKGYTVEMSLTAPDLNGVAPWVFATNSSKSSATLTGLTSGDNIWVHVRANGAGQSHGGYSDPAMLIVP